MDEKKYPGLIIQRHRVVDLESKEQATKSLWGWKLQRVTPAEWFDALSAGHTILFGDMSPTPEGKYTHGEGYWNRTWLIALDGDYFRGVSFHKKTGEDLHPEGLEPWTEQKGLSDLYPNIKADIYAVSQSVSSMAEWYKTPHRRYRLIFCFDEPITSGDMYRHVANKLGEKYPIIAPDERQPAQPIFGNARKGFEKVHTVGTVLPLAAFLEDFRTDREQAAQSKADTKKKTRKNASGGKKLPKIDSRDDLERLAHECGAVRESEWKSKSGYDVCRTFCPLCNRKDNGKLTYSLRGECGYGCHSATCDGKDFQDLYEAAGFSKSEWGGTRQKAGRRTNAEKSKEAQPIKTGRPTIFLNSIEDTGGDLVYSDRPRFEVAEDVAKVLFNPQTDTNLYRRDLELGSLRRGGVSLRFKPYTVSGMQGVISRCISLQKFADGGIVEIANPTKWIAEDILENHDIEAVTPIHIILTHPYHDGTSLQIKEGLNEEMGVFLDLKAETIDDDIEAYSAADDIQLWRDWLKDFPFRDEADFENALGYVLTLLIRPGLPVGEVSPMFLVTAPREGVGKTLLIDVLNAAATGVPTETRTLGDTPAEIKKELGAALRGAPELLVFDNVSPSKRLDSASLASLVTQVRGAFRVLGASEEQTYENRVTTAYTGSNIELTPELVKRVVAIRLTDLGVAEKDREVTVDNILSETLNRHHEFISSLVRMVKRWIENPPERGKPQHRMREWSVVIDGILKTNGIGESFLQNTDEVLLQAGDEFTALANGYKAIAENLGPKAFEGFIINDIFLILSHEDKIYSPEDEDIDGKTKRHTGDDILGDFVDGKSDKARSTKLGQYLRSKVGAVYGGYRLIDTHGRDRGKRKIYKLESVGASAEDDTLKEILQWIDGTPSEDVDAIIAQVMVIAKIEYRDAIDYLANLIETKKIVKRGHAGKECYFRGDTSNVADL